MVLGKYYYKRNHILLFIGGFLVACLSHGVYDFFIINEETKVWVVPFIILLLQSWWFVHIVNNCLNNSTHFDPQIKLKTGGIGTIVCGGLFLIIVIVYVHTAVTISADYAVIRFFIALAYYFYPIFFLNVCINRLDIFEGEWNKFSLKKFIDPRVFFAGINHKYSSMPGKKIVLSPYGRQTLKLLPFLPLRSEVKERLRIGDYKGWFHFELDFPLVIAGKYYHSIYFRTKDNEVPFEDDQRNLVAIYALKDPELKAMGKPETKDLIFIDWAFLNIVP